jgi:hypothetical protein
MFALFALYGRAKTENMCAAGINADAPPWGSIGYTSRIRIRFLRITQRCKMRILARNSRPAPYEWLKVSHGGSLLANKYIVPTRYQCCLIFRHHRWVMGSCNAHSWGDGGESSHAATLRMERQTKNASGRLPRWRAGTSTTSTVVVTVRSTGEKFVRGCAGIDVQ